MLDAYIPAAEGGELCPRVLGMTATLSRRDAKDAIRERKLLECILQATVISPLVDGPEQTLREVDWEREDVPLCVEQLLRRKLLDMLKAALVSNKVVDDKGLEQVFMRAFRVLTQLGHQALMFYVKECVLRQLEAAALTKDMYSTRPAVNSDEELAMFGLLTKTETIGWRERIPEIQAQLRDAYDDLEKHKELHEAVPRVSAKACRLLELLEEHAQGDGARPHDVRIIIFVELVAMTFPLADLINRSSSLCAGAVSGCKGMTESDREASLQDFHSGRTQVLVSTSVLEEGYDMEKCGVVIRFDRYETTKSHVQAKGRARARGAVVYCFENDPEHEETKAVEMDRVARDDGLAVSEEQKRKVRAHLAMLGRTDWHPFFPNPSRRTPQINLYNCTRIFDNYVKNVLRQQFDPEDLWTYAESAACGCEGQSAVKALKYPSPQGWQQVSVTDVELLLQGAGASEDLWPAIRCANMSNSDKDRNSFIYSACVQMSKRGFLSHCNLPSQDARTKSHIASLPSLPEPKGSQSLKSKYKRESLKRTSTA
eukprot:CAMPEP_0204525426 /NCGR_PEP_ID=MMETSP0661-20131031/7902_1 /ASSEMBLY_ACC=CAM_ASM_000606 /TAXON_ID=109239 /ORGANISM="Alexandrium margalefi, Strain AMGDE01CS-322" /LENGTH=540 /DNA_ID=CAMNT_0051531225 /DNA_START=1 /DNA_END=1623 /DNA_ORIENTATION=-